ncbi:hypothetical protein AGOR_G00044930 [Albula goreensis]|uniref:Phostensin n=1 Tax=Albula goreensis TaxID=1534307 RepID=A0A8T3DZG9_9TELE|nr:hypothetical protein AGOR_G00044930 [Albula goreensis]
MSVSASLPEWKQLLLDRKRKEEEEKERREREEEERLASMPAWKRGIIQRRRAKQEGGGGAWGAGGGERGREEGSLEHPQVGTATAEAESRVSMETIPPVRQNPFIRSQSGWRRGGGGGGGGREGEGGGGEVVGVPAERGMKGRAREGERGKAEGTEQGNRRAQDGEHERDGETRDERDMQERRDSREKKERGNGRERDTDSPRGRREDESKDGDPPYPLFPRPLVPHLRTIRAENIIIIEKEREERRERERERDERGGEGGAAQDEDEKRGMRMDLREILAVGGSVTEIRASEVLIIKPVMEERSACRDREASGPVWRDRDREKEWGRVREVETCVQRVAERERGGEVRGAGLVEEGRGPAETGGRVSQLLSKFGEHPKPPSRSKSTDCFVLRPPKDREGKEGGEEEEEEARKRREANAGKGTGTAFRGVPKRSFSFSDRVIRDRENRRETQGCRGDGPGGRGPDETVGGACGQTAANEESVGPREPMRAEPKILGDVKRKGERGKERERETEEGFTVASVKNTEGIGFARRVQARLVSVSVEEEETDSALHSPRVFHPTQTPLLPGDGDDGQVEGPGARRCAQVRGESHGQEGGGEGEAEEERSDGGESLSSLLTEEKELEPHYLPPSLSSSPTTSSLSPSPPLPPSLIDMSRIYTLAFVAGPADADANTEADRPKHRAETGPGEKGPETRPGPEIRGGGRREGADSGAGLGVGGVQRQLEQLRLKEQDSRRRPKPLPGSKATTTDERPGVFSKGKDEAQGVLRGVLGKGGRRSLSPPKTTPAAAAPPPATKTAPSAHTPTPNGMGEVGKKRYPTAEEIQVIGGYESLEKSCLVKHRGKHRGVKVCFDEVQLEQVCEYPSESSMLACFPCSTPLSSERERDEREEDDEEEEEEEKATFMSGGSKKAGPKAGRALKVDESCRR